MSDSPKRSLGTLPQWLTLGVTAAGIIGSIFVLFYRVSALENNAARSEVSQRIVTERAHDSLEIMARQLSSIQTDIGWIKATLQRIEKDRPG